MSYDCASGLPRSPYANYFSNPNVIYQERSTGTETEDNARTIKENMVRTREYKRKTKYV